MSLGIAEFLGSAYSQLQAQVGVTNANVAVMALSIAVYAAVIGLFYKTLSRRNIIDIDWSRVGTGFVSQVVERVKFALEYIIVFPLATFVWFILLSIALFFMSQTGAIADMMFIAISLVAATRVCAYYDEEIAGDIAKLIPLAILGAFIAGSTMFSAEIIEDRIAEILMLLESALPYLWMLMVLEVVLRLLFLVKRAIWPEKKAHKAKPAA